MSRLVHITFVLLVFTILSACSHVSISTTGQGSWNSQSATPQVEEGDEKPQALVFRLPIDQKFPR
ncbi:MAG: hypothetical protein H6624_05160 [Bdellovibrionaceae bacterium]|nr:hypothetical protein [Bdellovibrionales bacterium]MCB9083708.1 hypothetical protein [Pseudobdellovibrionaceae bacterium]